MPMNATDIDAMKKLIAASRKTALNFGFCLASKPEESAFFLDKMKSADVLAKRAKKAAGGSKVAYGTASTDGTEINLHLIEDAPSGLVIGAKNFFKAHGLMFKINLLESEDEDAPKLSDGPDGPNRDLIRWAETRNIIAAALAENLSRLEERSSISAAWAMAQQKGEDEDYAGALKIAEKVERDYAAACKAFATEAVKTTLGRFDKVKKVLSNEDRQELRGMVEPILKLVGKKPLADIEKVVKAFDAEIVKRAKAAAARIDQRAKPVEEKLAAADGDFAVELKTLENKSKDVSREVRGLNSQLAQAEKLLKDLPKKKGNASKKREAAQKINERIEGLVSDISAKTLEVEEYNAELVKQIQAAKKNHGELTSLDKSILVNIKGNVDAAKKEIAANPLAAMQLKLKATIKEMGDALKWQEEQVERTESGENTHGTGRHGAQTGVDRQARRAATGGDAPDSDGNEFGTTQSIKTWNGAQIEWEQDATTGKRKVKSRTPVEKSVADEVIRSFESDKGSSFNTPVLEKAAVDKAIGIMAAKDWTKIHSNSRGWHDLLSVALVVEAPQGLDLDGTSYTKSWGYSVSRKEAATMALEAANAVIVEFEKGDINETEMLAQLGIAKLLDGKALKKIPFATVVLERANIGAAWKSKTHYPNDTKTAESLDIAGRKVRNASGNETVAAL